MLQTPQSHGKSAFQPHGGECLHTCSQPTGSPTLSGGTTVLYLVRKAKSRVEEGKVHHVLLRLAAADGRQMVPQGQQQRNRRIKLALWVSCRFTSHHVVPPKQGR